MDREELEVTAPIEREKLLGLLGAMGEADSPRRKRRARSRLAPELLTAAEQRAAQTVADVRARLDRPSEATALYDTCERTEFPILSRRVLQQRSREEIGMLPLEMRLQLPAVPAWNAPPRIELQPVPGEDAVASLPFRGRQVSVSATNMTINVAALLVFFVASCFIVVGFVSRFL